MLTRFEILDSITESMAIIESSGQIIFTNKAWRTFSKENAGNDLYTGPNNNYLITCDTVIGEELKLADDASFGIQEVIDKKRDFFELEYPCHSPQEDRWFILRASQVLTYPELTLLTHINITNRKLAELEIEKNYIKSLVINERIHTTLYKIVHDIQNPLSGIIGLVDLLKSEKDIKTINTYLELIDEGSSNLSVFVTETLKHLSNSNNSESINVTKKINKSLEDVQHLLRSNNIATKLNIHQKSEFHTNAIEFQSILSNLIGNAAKYFDASKTDKYIIISFSASSEKAILSVEDNGIGINEEDIPQLIEFQYQVKKDSKNGVGLGLFMVQKSIDLIGGSLKITSELGVGSKFIVEIPNKI